MAAEDRNDTRAGRAGRETLGAASALLLTLAALTLAAPLLGADELERQIDRAARRARSEVRSLGMIVVEAGSGRVVAEHRADVPMIVASNVKLVTTAMALEALGPGFQFETRLLAKGRVEDGTLSGHLAVVGGGDPNLSGRTFDGDPLAVFAAWAKSLRALGVDRFEGEIYLDHGLFDDERVHPDWPRDQRSRWYEAPVDALSFSDNCVLVRITPGRAAGQPATVQVLPEVGTVSIVGQVTTTASRRHHRVAVDRIGDSNRIRVSGSVLRGAAAVETWVSIADPVSYFGDALARGLERGGLVVTARAREVSELPLGPWLEVASFRSDLFSTLEVINRRSQNFYAESLLKLLAARICGAGTWQNGRRLMSDFLARLGIEPPYTLADGSGMSRNNRLAARQIAQVLTYMYGHRLREEFMLTLPFSGAESHERWRSRLASDPYRGNVLAKTGTLRGVSTLSGYARARSGRVYVFSILCNGLRSVWPGRRAQDRIVRAIIDHG